MTPAQLRELVERNAVDIQPCSFLGSMPISSLFDVAGEAIFGTTLPPPYFRLGSRKVKPIPSLRKSWMLNNPSKLTDRRNCCRKAPTVVSNFETMSSLAEPRQPRPPGTWGVRHHRVWASIQPCISAHVPRIYFREVEVAAISLHKQSSDHGCSHGTSGWSLLTYKGCLGDPSLVVPKQRARPPSIWATACKRSFEKEPQATTMTP